MKTKIYFSALLLTGCALLSKGANPVNAQITDTLSLPEITVNALAFDIPDRLTSSLIRRYQVQNIPGVASQSSGDIIGRNSRFLVRGYGPGQSQTTGSTGFTTSQVKVLWNGMEMNHPMLGLTDLSLIPASMISTISVDNNLGSSEYGASAMGGTVLLETRPLAESSTILNTSIGSFNDQQYFIQRNQIVGRLHVSAALAYTNQKNDYQYTGLDGHTLRRQNAQKDQITSVVTARYQSGNYWNDTAFWVNSGESGAPGSLTFPSSDALQKDASLKLMHASNWKLSDVFAAQTTFSYHDVQLDYSDPAFATNSESNTKTISGSISLRALLHGGNQLRFRTGHNSGWINSTDYEIGPVGHFYGQMNALLNPIPRINIYPSIRYDTYTEFGDEWSFGVGINSEILDNQLYAIGNINRNFSPPTFNDLYWPFFGNPDLTPEISVKWDMGIRFISNSVEISAIYFNSKIENGIIWWADDMGNYKPSNVNAIETKGISTVLDYSTRWGGTEIDFSLGWTILNGKYNDRNGDDSVAGNSLVYSPRNKLNSSVSTRHEIWGIALYHEFTDKRYASDVNTSQLNAYHLVDISFYYIANFIPFKPKIVLRTSNLFNETYQHVMDYPMPSRYLNLGLELKF